MQNVLIKTMTMMALMLAPAYKGLGEYGGWGRTGSLIGGLLVLVLGVACWGLVAVFRRRERAQYCDAMVLKKAADAKVRLATAAASGGGGGGGGGGVGGGGRTWAAVAGGREGGEAGDLAAPLMGTTSRDLHA